MNNITKAIIAIGTVLMGAEVVKARRSGSLAIKPKFYTLPLDQQQAFIMEMIGRIDKSKTDICFAPGDLKRQGMADGGKICPSDILNLLGLFGGSNDNAGYLASLSPMEIQNALMSYNNQLEMLQNQILSTGKDFVAFDDLTFIDPTGVHHQIISAHIGMPYIQMPLFEQQKQQRKQQQKQQSRQQSRDQKLFQEYRSVFNLPQTYSPETASGTSGVAGIDFQSPLRTPSEYKPQSASSVGDGLGFAMGQTSSRTPSQYKPQATSSVGDGLGFAMGQTSSRTPSEYKPQSASSVGDGLGFAMGQTSSRTPSQYKPQASTSVGSDVGFSFTRKIPTFAEWESMTQAQRAKYRR